MTYLEIWEGFGGKKVGEPKYYDEIGEPRHHPGIPFLSQTREEFTVPAGDDEEKKSHMIYQ